MGIGLKQTPVPACFRAEKGSRGDDIITHSSDSGVDEGLLRRIGKVDTIFKLLEQHADGSGRLPGVQK